MVPSSDAPCCDPWGPWGWETQRGRDDRGTLLSASFPWGQGHYPAAGLHCLSRSWRWGHWRPQYHDPQRAPWWETDEAGECWCWWQLPIKDGEGRWSWADGLFPVMPPAAGLGFRLRVARAGRHPETIVGKPQRRTWSETCCDGACSSCRRGRGGSTPRIWSPCRGGGRGRAPPATARSRSARRRWGTWWAGRTGQTRWSSLTESWSRGPPSQLATSLRCSAPSSSWSSCWRSHRSRRRSRSRDSRSWPCRCVSSCACACCRWWWRSGRTPRMRRASPRCGPACACRGCWRRTASCRTGSSGTPWPGLSGHWGQEWAWPRCDFSDDSWTLSEMTSPLDTVDIWTSFLPQKHPTKQNKSLQMARTSEPTIRITRRVYLPE